MICPACKKEYHCGCKSCSARSKDGKVLSIQNDDDTVSCGHCKHTMHYDDWFAEEGRQYAEMREKWFVCQTTQS